MCWSEGASVAMVGIGAAATVITTRRGEPSAIPITLGFFTLMEALQVAGYWVVDECSLPVNQSVTVLSYIHIALQPIFINAFAMAVAPAVVPPATRRLVYAAAGLATILILMRLVPFDWAGRCRPGDILCGPAFCTFSGNWHIAWEMQLNDMWGSLGEVFRDYFPFPAYVLSVFVLPLFYGAWRLVIFHAMLGPMLATVLTDNPNEIPAVWCLFSIGLVLGGLSPLVRRHVFGAGRSVADAKP
ncbi:DUF5765 domain-containing protein [Marimonas arenosa]|uniref:DUF5765 domain-containing protein n=1 Tax=Marimonas arenosa TaxID=1795305 RepID=A0AAE3WFG6_9RHOB|nr:DUF5765 domain-containing protein [Marimonas arenosa]MDQ2090673.1 DUF5765 domain-containing protein [Marimonas arenosa]